jgi:hypothetical protein
MSFGFSPGDVVAAARLAGRLHEALRDCPAEAGEVLKDLPAVYWILSHIKDDLGALESAIKAHGEERTKFLAVTVRDLEKTPDEVKKLVER